MNVVIHYRKLLWCTCDPGVFPAIPRKVSSVMTLCLYTKSYLPHARRGIGLLLAEGMIERALSCVSSVHVFHISDTLYSLGSECRKCAVIFACRTLISTWVIYLHGLFGKRLHRQEHKTVTANRVKQEALGSNHPRCMAFCASSLL